MSKLGYLKTYFISIRIKMEHYTAIKDNRVGFEGSVLRFCQIFTELKRIQKKKL